MLLRPAVQALSAAVVTTQSALTLVTPIAPGRQSDLQTLLESTGQRPADNQLVPFENFQNVHFARFFILPQSTDLQGRSYPAYLIFLADVDGPADAFLLQLVGACGDGLHTIYQHGDSYPGRAGLRDYLREHAVGTAASYVNTVGRTVTQVHQEAQLHDAIQQYLEANQDAFRTSSPRHVRAAIQEYVEREPSLAWAKHPFPQPDVTYLVSEKLQFALVGAAGILLFPAILLGAPCYLALLRWHETHDVAQDVVPDDALIQKLAAQEDHGVQNPFTSAGFLEARSLPQIDQQRGVVGNRLPGTSPLQPRQPDRRENNPFRPLGAPG